MSVTPEMIQSVRWETGDVDIALPIMSSDEITYYLNKHGESIRRASLDVAKTILFKLSMSASRRTVDILSIDNTKIATAYKEALLTYIKNDALNGALGNILPYAGGISISDMEANNTGDNNYVKPPVVYTDVTTLVF